MAKMNDSDSDIKPNSVKLGLMEEHKLFLKQFSKLKMEEILA